MAGKPIPTHLKLLKGTARKCRTNPNEPMPSGDLTSPPEWMTESQKASWNFAIQNSPKGLLKQLDQSILTIWVTAEDLHRQALEGIEKNGMLVKAPNTGLEIQSPYLPIVNKQAQIMMKAATELGFSPSSRSKVSVTPEATGESPWDKFLPSMSN